MGRSLFAGSLLALVVVGAASLASCSSDPETTTSGPTGSTSTGPGSGSGGTGGEGTTTTTIGSGGTGGTGGGGVGGAGQGGMNVGGAGQGGMNVGGAGVGGAGVGGAGQGGMNVGGAGVGGQGGAPNPDQDGDGWTPADGDCCDVPSGDCQNPELVNPGAFEYLGNMVDDDCDPSTLDTVAADLCSFTMDALQTPTSSQELVKALDLCNFTTENPPLPERRWGVISSALLLADGSANMPPKDKQVGVLVDFGPNVHPKKGETMAALSSGTARDEGDPGHIYPQNGNQPGQVGNFDANTVVSAPAAYLAQHGGKLPNKATCPECNGPNCSKAFDSVNLKLRIRVPTNAFSLSYNFKFYTAEFPEFVCQEFNDFFITLLSSGYQQCPPPNPMDPCLPVDKNIAFDAVGSPVSVNNAFLQVCFPPPGAPAGTCPGGTLELIGTGMGGWNGSLVDGGGTNWLFNDAPVTPGETIEIEFVTFDAGDHNVDSRVLIDNFRWKITPSKTGVHM